MNTTEKELARFLESHSRVMQELQREREQREEQQQKARDAQRD